MDSPYWPKADHTGIDSTLWGGVDDRAEELHQSHGKFEAQGMHGLIR